MSIPAAPVDLKPARTSIIVRSGGRPLPGADLLVMFPNGTWKHVVTDEGGEVLLDLHTTILPMTVFVAAAGHGAHLERDWVPGRGTLVAALRPLPRGGAILMPKGDGAVPGIRGRLNPIRDTLDRTYLYASNIAINEVQSQPVPFIPGDDMRLTDADGNEAWIRIVAVEGRAALVEHRPVVRAAGG